MLKLKLYQLYNQEILLAYKLCYCRNNTVAPIIFVKTNETFIYGCKNENYEERNILNEYMYWIV